MQNYLAFYLFMHIYYLLTMQYLNLAALKDYEA